MNESGESEGGEEAVRQTKKGRPEGQWRASDAMDVIFKEDDLSFKEKLLYSERVKESFDGKGSNVFDEAWRDHIESLKGFFSGEGKKDNGGGMEDDSDDEDCVTIEITQEEYERWCAPWKKSLIIKLMGKTVPFWVMKRSLESMWKASISFKIRDLENGYFVVSFEEEKDLNFVYQEGPWMISGHYLIVQRWRPNFDPWNAECQKKVAVWIRIPLLPLEFFNMEALQKIGSGIGRPLKVDAITHTSDRGRFARVCVELDLQKRLKATVKILGRKRFIEYEGLHLICFRCGKYGHHRDACPGILKKEDHVTGDEGKKQNHNAKNSAEVKRSEVPSVSSTGVKSQDTGTSEFSKRPRERDNVYGRDGGGYSPEKDGMGIWNLARRRDWGRMDDRKAKFSGSQSHVIRERNIRGEYCHESGNEKKQANSSGSNHKMWVPVNQKEKNFENSRVSGREKKGPRKSNHEAISGPLEEKSSFLNAPNPFAVLGEVNEDNMMSEPSKSLDQKDDVADEMYIMAQEEKGKAHQYKSGPDHGPNDFMEDMGIEGEGIKQVLISENRGPKSYASPESVLL